MAFRKRVELTPMEKLAEVFNSFFPGAFCWRCCFGELCFKTELRLENEISKIDLSPTREFLDSNAAKSSNYPQNSLWKQKFEVLIGNFRVVIKSNCDS